MKDETGQNTQRVMSHKTRWGRERGLSFKPSDMVAVTAMIVASVCLFFLVSGHFNKTGANPDAEVSDAVNCESDEIAYPYATEKLDEISHRTKINMVFTGEELSVIGLTYDIGYANEQRANEALQMLTPEINIAMNEAGIKGEFITNTKLTRNGEHVLLNIFARQNDISKASADFLLMQSGLEKDKNGLIEHYKGMGFSCVVKKEG